MKYNIPRGHFTLWLDTGLHTRYLKTGYSSSLSNKLCDRAQVTSSLRALLISYGK